VGVGFLQLTPDSFYSMTFEELRIMAEGRRELIATQVQTSWEVARWQSVFILQPHLKKGRTLKPTDLAQFPWEEKHVHALPTAEQVALLRKFVMEEYERDRAMALKRSQQN
jgi:hypothetical protein